MFARDMHTGRCNALSTRLHAHELDQPYVETVFRGSQMKAHPGSAEDVL